MSLFKQASMKKLRFATAKGNATVEDLWDLPLGNLRTMANTINRSLKKEDDLFAVRSATETLDSLRLSVIISVIETRESLKVRAVETAENASKRKVLKDLIEQKTLEQQGSRSIEDLQKELESL